MSAKGHPADSAGSTYELGDLDVAATKAQPAAAPAPLAGGDAVASSARHGSQDLDFDDLDTAASPLELGAADNENWRGSTAHLTTGTWEDDDPLHDTAGALPELDMPAGPARLSNTRIEREARELEGSHEWRARELGDYGRAPAGLLRCIPYSFTVLRRKQALAGERKPLERELSQLRGRLDEALLDLGRALISQNDAALDHVKDEIEAVRSAQHAAEAADQNAAAVRRETEAQIRHLDTQLAQRKQAAEPFEEAAKRAAAAFEELDHERKRAEAMLSRVDIELRALAAATEPTAADRITALQVQRGERERELEQARMRAEEGKEQHERARAALGEHQRESDQLATQRRRLADQADKQQRKLEDDAQGAESELTRRLRALGQAACACGIDTLGGARGQRARDLEGEQAELRERLELYRMALGAYDRGAFARGVGLLAALGAGLATAATLLL